MKKIIFATGNEDKMKEIRKILADPSLEILSRMAEERRSVPPWRGALDTRKKARTVLAMTRSFIFRNMVVLPQSFPWKKRTGSAIVEKLFAL